MLKAILEMVSERQPLIANFAEFRSLVYQDVQTIPDSHIDINSKCQLEFWRDVMA
ncbi:MAG: hypothetical protein ACU88J_02200 [Gammaproteobacteria bacterium]